MKDDAAATLTVKETIRLLGISRVTAYRAIKRGDLPAIRVGKRILILKAALQRKYGPDILNGL